MAQKPPITIGDDGRTPTTAVQQSDGGWAQPTASGDGYHVSVGAKGDPVATGYTGSWSLISLLKGVLRVLLDLPQSYVGYSHETKPAGKRGDSYLELDTGDVYLHDGTRWVKF